MPTNKYLQTLKMNDFPKVNRDIYNEPGVVDRLIVETSYIPHKSIPVMPFKTVGDHIKEYHKIWLRQSELSTLQRIIVKNVVHSEIRCGNLIPNFDVNESKKLSNGK